jgi:hypothetical protein
MRTVQSYITMITIAWPVFGLWIGIALAALHGFILRLPELHRLLQSVGIHISHEGDDGKSAQDTSGPVKTVLDAIPRDVVTKRLRIYGRSSN